MWLFWLFIAVPIIEIALFIQVGGLIGLWPTLALVLLSAVAGTAVMRSQGAHAWMEVQRSFAELRDPSRPLAHGAMILFAGMLLLTPGFFTDTCGLLLLIPPVRDRVIRYVSRRIQVTPFGMSAGGARRETHRPPYGDGVIDGDYVVEDEPVTHQPRTPPDLPPELPDDETIRRGNSGWTRH
jgi:UPF0716 protein FxsA